MHSCQESDGPIALGLGQGQPETEFHAGLRRFSMLLVQVAAVLTSAIFIINVALHKPAMTALEFSLAIAVGITPQLLPAVVSASLAAGSRQLARSKVLVKRLVCSEDLGDIDGTKKSSSCQQAAVVEAEAARGQQHRLPPVFSQHRSDRHRRRRAGAEPRRQRRHRRRAGRPTSCCTPAPGS